MSLTFPPLNSTLTRPIRTCQSALLAVLGHIALGHAGQSIALRGDSVTALTWAITERYGSIATNASMIWTLLCVAADVHVTDITHIPGTDNDNCDQLSRRGPTPSTTIAQHAANLGLGDAPHIPLDTDTDVSTLLRLCRPSILTSTDAQFSAFWKEARSSTDRFVSKHPPSHSPHSTVFPPPLLFVPTHETDTPPTL